MPKYLFNASYTQQGLAGLLEEGGTSRRAMVEKMVANLGGSLDALYYAFGDADVWGIIDAPDDATVAAVSMTVGASGAVRIATTKLLTPEEIDEAAKKTVEYRAPGA